MSDELHIPDNPRAITADWLHRALSNGTGSRIPPIREVTMEEIGAGLGMVGTLLRCHLTYQDGAGFAPASLIVKLPSPDENTRRTARQLRLYQREYDFYRALAPHVDVQTPALLYGDFNVADHTFVLLLEDLGHMESADQVDGASERQAMSAVRAAAGFHGQFWNRVNRPPVSEVHVPSTPEQHAMMQSVYQRSLPRACELFGDHFPTSMRTLAESYGSQLAKHSAAMASGAQTLIHGDFRLDNMFFDRGDNAGVALVDWQISGIGSGLYDVAYFLSSSVTTDVRRAIERDAIQTYRDVVYSACPGTLTADECWRSYRHAMLTCFRVPVIGGAQLDLSNERGRRLAEVFLRRTLTAIDDLDAGEFLLTDG